jgi:hypothetical protein
MNELPSNSARREYRFRGTKGAGQYRARGAKHLVDSELAIFVVRTVFWTGNQKARRVTD